MRRTRSSRGRQASSAASTSAAVTASTAVAGKDKEANWLPAPKGKFQLVMRLYAPRKTAPSVLDGSWTPPPVRKAP